MNLVVITLDDHPDRLCDRALGSWRASQAAGTSAITGRDVASPY